MRYYAAMLRRLILIACLLATVACGSDSPNPTAPTPIQRANLVPEGQLSDGQNSFTGQARNTLGGCARGVRGVTRLEDPRGQTVARGEWSLPASRVIRSRESFIYGGLWAIDFRSTPRGDSVYFTDIFWTDVRCP